MGDFEAAFGPGGEIRATRAPYRTCPLGAHTDHQRGLVIGFTIQPALHLIFRARSDTTVLARSRDIPGEARFTIGARDPAPPGFGAYLHAVATRLGDERPVRHGIDAWIAGELAPGGIGSSAALQVAFLVALADANGLRLDRLDAMHLVVGAERAGPGVQVGLLDPAVILFGEAGHLVFVDCAEGTPRVQKLAASLPPFEFLLVDSGVDRDLGTSPYNDRVAECRAAAAALGATGHPPSLREVTLEHLRRRRREIDPTLARRAEHVLSENKRVRVGLAALQQGDLASFGRLVDASGQSMIRLFDAGVPQTELLLDQLREHDDVLGATLSGAGFGGHVLAIVRPGSGAGVFERVRAALAARFPEAGGRASFAVSGTGPGASLTALGAR